MCIRDRIISLYINDFSDANFTHFCEIVESDIGMKISDTTPVSYTHLDLSSSMQKGLSDVITNIAFIDTLILLKKEEFLSLDSCLL